MREDKRYFDKAIDSVLYDAVPIAEVQIVDEVNSEIPKEFETSKSHDRKMRKIIKSYERKIYFKKLISYSKVAAIILLAFIVTATASVMSVEAWRIKVLNLFVNKNDTHSDVKFNEVPPAQGSKYEIQAITFEYMPEGFKPEVRRTEPENIFVNFSNGDQYFSFTFRPVSGSFKVDTEESEIEKIIMGKHEALLSKKQDRYILLWNEADYSYQLSGNIDKTLLIKIGENIKK